MGFLVGGFVVLCSGVVCFSVALGACSAFGNLMQVFVPMTESVICFFLACFL